MPIIRREDRPDQLSPQALYLWRRRWALILPAVAVTIATFFLTYLLKEEYVATGQVFVNRFAANDADALLPNPASVARLLESHLLLRRVRDDYIEKFGGTPREIPVERFSRQFKVDSEVLQDTSVRKEISPILELSVRATGTEQTRFLMDSWLQHFMQMFGNYATLEAVQKRDALLEENMELEERLGTAEQELTLVEARLPMYQKSLYELMNTVASADIPQRAQGFSDTAPDQGFVTGQSTQVNLSVGTKPPGLLSRLVDLRIEERMAENGAATRPLELVRAEQQAVTAAINDVQTSVAELQMAVAEGSARSSSLERRIRMMTAYQGELRQRLNTFQIASTVYDGAKEEEGVSAGADVRVLAGPVTPELKVWPRRTLTALGAGMAVFVLSAVLLLALRAMRRAAVQPTPQRTEEVGAGT